MNSLNRARFLRRCHWYLIDQGKGGASCDFVANTDEMGGSHIKAHGIVVHTQFGVEPSRQGHSEAREELRRFAGLLIWVRNLWVASRSR